MLDLLPPWVVDMYLQFYQRREAFLEINFDLIFFKGIEANLSMIHSEATLAKNSTWILVFIGIKECTRCWWCNWKIASEPGQAWGPLLGQESPGECFSFVLPLFSGRASGSPVGIDHLVVYGLQPGMPSSHHYYYMSITWSRPQNILNLCCCSGIPKISWEVCVEQLWKLTR